MPEDKTNDGLDPIEGEGEGEEGIQELVLSEIEAQQKSILDAAKLEGGSLFAENETEDLLASMRAEPPAPEPKDKSKKKEAKEGIRFSNMKEAEIETRKLQSERDTLVAKVEKLESGGDPAVEQAKLLLEDIRNDPKLAAGLNEYFKSGEFVAPVAKPDDDGSEFSLDEEGYGSEGISAKQIDAIVDEKVNERLKSVQQETAQQAWLTAQKQALLEAYPDLDDDGWNDLMRFAQDPKGATLVNLYRLKNVNREVEDRAKVLAERMLRTGGVKMRPSVGGAAGAAGDAGDADPQVEVLRGIVEAGRKQSIV